MRFLTIIVVLAILACIQVMAHQHASGVLPDGIRESVMSELADAAREDKVAELNSLYTTPASTNTVVDDASRIAERSFLTIEATERELPVDLLAEAEQRHLSDEKPLSHEMTAAELVADKSLDDELVFLQLDEAIEPVKNTTGLSAPTVLPKPLEPTSTHPVHSGVHHGVLVGYKRAVVIDATGKRVKHQKTKPVKIKTVPAGSLPRKPKKNNLKKVKTPSEYEKDRTVTMVSGKKVKQKAKTSFVPNYYRPGERKKLGKHPEIEFRTGSQFVTPGFYPSGWAPAKTKANPRWYSVPKKFIKPKPITIQQYYAPVYAAVIRTPNVPLRIPAALQPINLSPPPAMQVHEVGKNLVITQNGQVRAQVVGGVTSFPTFPKRDLARRQRERSYALGRFHRLSRAAVIAEKKAILAERRSDKATSKAERLLKFASDTNAKSDIRAAARAVRRATGRKRIARLARKLARRALRRAKRAARRARSLGANLKSKRRFSFFNSRRSRSGSYPRVVHIRRQSMPRRIDMARILKSLPVHPPLPPHVSLRHAAEDLKKASLRKIVPGSNEAVNAVSLALDARRASEHLKTVATQANGLAAANHQLPGSFTPRPRFQRLRTEIQQATEAGVSAEQLAAIQAEADAAGEAAAQQVLQAHNAALAAQELQHEMESEFGLSAEQKLGASLKADSEMTRERALDFQAKEFMNEQMHAEQQINVAEEQQFLHEAESIDKEALDSLTNAVKNN